MRLGRFITAQSGSYATALAELRQGRKVTHWMWFIFPQLAALGRSPMAQRFGIAGLAEARAYLADPVLGPRLHEAARAVLAQPELGAEQIFGPLDALKLRSSATLFEAAGGGPEFTAILDRLYAKSRCPRTLAAMGTAP
ncbi:MAG: DUF1810 domain-containing protein [Pseudorhodobacter sp.]|nr:DUF1810 domain-containing protein [Pseudorhodobacter sp.]